MNSSNVQSPSQRLNRVVEDGLCIGCGLCGAVCGSDKIQISKDKTGELRPHVTGPLDHHDVDLVYKVCPGTRVEGLPMQIQDDAPNKDVIWGAYHQLLLGWATDQHVRYEGSTGGVLTALCQYLLRSKRVNFVYHVKSSLSDPTFGEATISRTPQDVLQAAGSRYGPTDTLSQFDNVLALGEPFALVGKPCDLNAVRNLAHQDPRVNRFVKYWLTPVCGGYMPTEAMDTFLETRGLTRDELTSLRYRGRGCPGPTTIEAKDGSSEDISYLDFWGEDESAWSLPFRCKVCPDGIGEGADIAAADSWPGGSPDRETSQSDPGTNTMIVRTSIGLELLEAAAQDGALAISGDVTLGELSANQPHQVKKKMFVAARYEGLAAAGRLVPETISLRLQECSQLADSAELERQKSGAFDRATTLEP